MSFAALALIAATGWSDPQSFAAGVRRFITVAQELV